MNEIQTQKEQLEAMRRRYAELDKSPRSEPKEKTIDLEINNVIKKLLGEEVETIVFGLLTKYLELIADQDDKNIIKQFEERFSEFKLAELEFEIRERVINVLKKREDVLSRKTIYLNNEEKQSFISEKENLKQIINYIESIDSDNSAWK